MGCLGNIRQDQACGPTWRISSKFELFLVAVAGTLHQTSGQCHVRNACLLFRYLLAFGHRDERYFSVSVNECPFYCPRVQIGLRFNATGGSVSKHKLVP